MVTVMRVFTHRDCLLHAAPAGFPESPRRLRGILDRLRRDGFEVVECEDHPEFDEAVRSTHQGEYVDRFRRAVERGHGLLDSADNPLSAGTWASARAAVSAVLAAADWTVAAPGRRSFAAVRPPGHHAERATAMGFCYLNNVAVAADHLRRRHGLERLAIFDFDVHHGNGTQHLFEDRGDVQFVSVHQFPFYPGTGAAGECGWGDGEGATLNVPLPAGTGDDGYRRALEREVEPAIRDFRPQMLLLSAGFDAWRHDPLGGMRVSREGMAEWGRRLGALADELCDGRLLASLEGGYDLASLPVLVSDHVRALDGA
jgi:acetoin utilization deacetylase AcuC-like enzyme